MEESESINSDEQKKNRKNKIKNYKWVFPIRFPLQRVYRVGDRRYCRRHFRHFVLRKFLKPQAIALTSLCLSLVLAGITFNTYQITQKNALNAAAVEENYEIEIKRAAEILYLDDVKNMDDKQINNKKGFVLFTKRLFKSCNLPWYELNQGVDDLDFRSKILFDVDLEHDRQMKLINEGKWWDFRKGKYPGGCDVFGSDYVGLGPYYPYKGRWKAEVVDSQLIVDTFKSDQCFHIYYKLGIDGDPIEFLVTALLWTD